MNLRYKLAKLLFKASMKLAPPEAMPPAYKTLQEELEPQRGSGAVIEADDTPQQWSPDQKGNVVIAEPLLMNKHRRGEL